MRQQILDYFKSLEFDEQTHTYTEDNIKLTPVSNMIKKYVETFDSEKVAYYYGLKKGKSTEEVLRDWKEIADNACKLGTKVHKFAENYCEDRRLIPSNGYEEAITKFYDIVPDYIEPMFTELQMFSKTFEFAGTADIIFYNKKTGKFKILDFKTNGDLFKNYQGKTMLKPFNFLLDNSYNKYQLQFSFYQILFQQTGYEVENRTLIWLKPDGTFECYKTEDYTKILLKDLINGKFKS